MILSKTQKLKLQMKTVAKLTYLDKSPIHGRGLFARADIPKDTILGTLQGKLCHHDGEYVLWLSKSEGFEVSCEFRYINHAKSANACYYDDLTVVALRNIKAHEEITHDYEAVDW